MEKFSSSFAVRGDEPSTVPRPVWLRESLSADGGVDVMTTNNRGDYQMVCTLREGGIVLHSIFHGCNLGEPTDGGPPEILGGNS